MTETRTVKTIPTWYDGYHFRSRLEARWAVFFKTLNIKYLYEPQGFDIDGVPYLPDFAILLWKTLWAEVKPAIGTDPNGESRFRALIASQPAGTRGVLLTDMADKFQRDYIVIWSEGNGGYCEDAASWTVCSYGYHFDVRRGGGDCESCAGTGTPPNSVLTADEHAYVSGRASRWLCWHDRVLDAYARARTFRFQAEGQFADEQAARLQLLPSCGRCARIGADGETRCEKCLDRAWDIENREPVTCGCGCWTRAQLEYTVRHRR